MMRRLTGSVMLAACLFLAVAGVSQASEPPLAAQLDILSTPTLGGGGRLIWVALPNVTAAPAVLSFSLEELGQSAPQCTSRTLALERGRTVEAEYGFATPRAGLYRVTALLRFTEGGREVVSSRVAAFTVAAPGKPGASPLASPAIAPLTVDGAQATAELGLGATAWYSFTIARQTIYTLQATPAYGISGVHLYLYGPNSQTKVLAEELSIQGNALLYYKMLAPGTYYLQVQSAKTTEAGTITVGVATTALGSPRVTSLAIEGGADTTFEHRVTLNMNCTGYPTEFMASESASFNGAVWLPYAGAVPFTLSSAAGNKTVYVKVRNAGGGVSAVRSDTIALQRLAPLAVNGEYAMGNIETAGSADWYVFDVTTEANYDIHTLNFGLYDTYLRLYGPDSTSILKAEDDDWRSASGSTTRAARILAHLAPGTYYVKAQAHDASVTGSFAVEILSNTGPILADIAVNNGASSSYSRTVGITFNAVGTITDYRVGESATLDGVAWQAYGGTPRVLYTLSAGDGQKKVYLQLRDKATGLVSQIMSDSVGLLVPQPLTLGQDLRCEIGTAIDANALELTTTVQGDYLLEITPDAPGASGAWLQQFDVYVYRPGSTSYLEADQSFNGEKKAQVALNHLIPGTRTIKIDARQSLSDYSQWYRGKYTVRVTQYTSATPLVAEFHITSTVDNDYYYRYSTVAAVSIYNNIFGNSVTQYKVSERSDFHGASWLPWSSWISFNLSSGSGNKTVYFKVKDSAGHESAVVSDSIQLIAPRSLTPGASAVTAYHGMVWPEVFEFSVTKAGPYTLEISAGSTEPVQALSWTELFLENYQSGGFGGAEFCVGKSFPYQKSFSLTPGTYKLIIESLPSGYGAAGDKGNYKIRVY